MSLHATEVLYRDLLHEGNTHESKKLANLSAKNHLLRAQTPRECYNKMNVDNNQKHSLSWLVPQGHNENNRTIKSMHKITSNCTPYNDRKNSSKVPIDNYTNNGNKPSIRSSEHSTHSLNTLQLATRCSSTESKFSFFLTLNTHHLNSEMRIQSYVPMPSQQIT